MENKMIFKGFQMLNGVDNEIDLSQLENGYLYFIRTASDNGFLYFNGKSYAKGDASVPADLSEVLDRIGALEEGKADMEEVYTKDEIDAMLDPSMIPVEPAADDIPNVYLIGEQFANMTTAKNEVTMRLKYVSRTKKFDSYIKIKFQGNSSLSYPKKNFTVKLYEDEAYSVKKNVTFRNWIPFNKFVLKANWMDFSHARNVVSARIWGDVVRSRSDYDELPVLMQNAPNHGAIDGFLCKVFVNGVYQGRYTWNLGKDAACFGKACEGAIASEDYQSGCFNALSTFTEDVDWTIEYPDEVLDSHKDAFNSAISLCMGGDVDLFAENIGNFLDVQSLIDYDLFGRVICHLDGFGKNQVFLNYGDKWYASAYDMDSTFGLYWDGTTIVSSSYRFQDDYESMTTTQSHPANGNVLYNMLEQAFKSQIWSRYHELREGPLSEENLIQRFEEFMSICPKDLANEDYAITTAEGAYTDIPSKLISNIQQIRKFVVERCAYCDNQVDLLFAPTEKVETPVIVLEGNVATVTCASEGAVMYYTLNGTIPTEASTVYTGPIELEEGQMLRVRAFLSGYLDSNIASKQYTSGPTANENVIVSDYSPNGQAFSYSAPVNFYRGDRIEICYRPSGTDNIANVISISDGDITQWFLGSDFKVHMYAPNLGQAEVSFMTATNLASSYASLAAEYIITMSKDGIIVNGESVVNASNRPDVSSLAYFNGTLNIGSEEGANRAYGTYAYIKVVEGTGAEELPDITETPIYNGSNITLNGKRSTATNVQTTNAVGDYTYLFDFTPTATNQNLAAVYSEMDINSPWYGIVLRKYQDTKYDVSIAAQQITFGTYANSVRTKIAVVVNSATSKFTVFFNGFKVGENTFSTAEWVTTSNPTPMLGGDQNQTNRYLKGTIHSAQIYSTALSDGQIIKWSLS